MTDRHTPEQRSANMARIRSSGTAPEERLYQSVRIALGYRWRIDRNVRAMPGCPDVVIPSLRLAIFADGCFFHGCPDHYNVPLSNVGYWKPKIAGNIARDKARQASLESNGWSVWRIWEHELTKNALPGTEVTLHRKLGELANKRRRHRDDKRHRQQVAREFTDLPEPDRPSEKEAAPIPKITKRTAFLMDPVAENG
jgi:DNA mismatch endonuclease, patch repair protein